MFWTPRPTLETSSEPSLRRPLSVEDRGLGVGVISLVGCPVGAFVGAALQDINESAASAIPALST